MTDPGFSQAMADALGSPILAEQLVGLPDDPREVPAALRRIQRRLADRAGPTVMAEVWESAREFVRDKDGNE
jgi:hypothetical protein